MTAPRVAVVHEWLVSRGGSELVVAQFLAEFPDAPLYTLFDHMSAAMRAESQLPRSRTTFLQHVPGVTKHYRTLLPLFPTAVRSHDIENIDVILTSHHSVAKGVRVTPQQVHICYCHSPPRYAYAQQDRYLEEHGITGLRARAAIALLGRLRRFDQRTAADVHRFIANSNTVAERIRSAYGRESIVIRPPIDTDLFTPSATVPRELDRYVAASRFVPYKRMIDIVTAFVPMTDRRLIVIGDGPERDAIRRAAGGARHINFLGEVSRDVLRDELRRARALVFAAEEDAGMLPVEAQSCGTPVIAYGRGGATETVIRDRTGIFFDAQSSASIRDAVQRFEQASSIDAAACRANAEPHGLARFRAAVRAEVSDAWALGPSRARR